jgi:hypothetical protein
MGALCCIDYYALMAEQYSFLPRLLAEFEGSDCSLALRPGTAFSLALARFRVEAPGMAAAARAGSSSTTNGA